MNTDLPLLVLGVVPISVRPEARRLAETYPVSSGPILARIRVMEASARQQGHEDQLGGFAALRSDLLLQTRGIAAARDALDANDAVRRGAVLDWLETPEDPRPLLDALERVTDPLDLAVLELALATLQPERLATVPASLDRARPSGAHAVARLGLLAALAYERAGDIERATVHALRSRIQGEVDGDSRLIDAATTVADRTGRQANDARVAELVRVSHLLGTATTPDALFTHIAAATRSLLDAERAFVVIAGSRAEPVIRGFSYGDGHEGPPSMSIATEVIESGTELITRDAGEQSSANSILAMNLRTVLCVPLTDGVEVLGCLYADSQSSSGKDLRELAWSVRTFAAYAAVVLRNADLLAVAETSSHRAREVAHDVRNVASGMSLGLDELRDLDLPDWASVVLGDLREMNRLLTSSLSNLLADTARTNQRVDLAQLVERSANIARLDARHKGVEIVLETVPAVVDGDPVELARVMANLLGNAIKYTPAGARVGVQIRTRDGQVGLVVADEGPGIPEHALSTIFAPGAQLSDSLEGYGLGLGICARLVHDHGGSIRARNRRGKGASFRILLPLVSDARSD